MGGDGHTHHWLHKEMKKLRIVLTLLLCLLAIPVSSVLYKTLLGFYGFKKAMCTHVVPRLMVVEDIPLPPETPALIRVGDLTLFSEWSPHAIKNEYSEINGVRLNLPENQTADLYLDSPPITTMKDWLTVSSGHAAVGLLEEAYGGWQDVKRDYPTDLNLLNAIVEKELPGYLSRTSPSMQYPLGYYVLPLFPPLKNYRKEYALFGVKSMESHTELPFLRATGKSRYFFIFRDGLNAEIVFGAKASGALAGAAILKGGKEDVITKELIGKVCLCLDEPANTRIDSDKQ